MKLLILAQNPKTEANVKKPLKGTKSWTILARWLEEAGIPESEVDLDNASQDVGVHPRIKEQKEKNLGRWIGLVARYPVIVTLGAFAEQAMEDTRDLFEERRWYHYNLPHPSGLNRKLNDKAAHEAAVRALKAAYERLKEKRRELTKRV